MTRQEYELIKKLSPETLQAIYKAIDDYDCHTVCSCKDCALSLDGKCVGGHLLRDKEVDA